MVVGECGRAVCGSFLSVWMRQKFWNTPFFDATLSPVITCLFLRAFRCSISGLSRQQKLNPNFPLCQFPTPDSLENAVRPAPAVCSLGSATYCGAGNVNLKSPARLPTSGWSRGMSVASCVGRPPCPLLHRQSQRLGCTLPRTSIGWKSNLPTKLQTCGISGGGIEN